MSCHKNKEKIEDTPFVFVKGGTFLMGREGDTLIKENIQSVTLDDFKIGKYEITNAEYCKFLNVMGNSVGEGGTWLYLDYSKIIQDGNHFVPKAGFENHPVVVVSWEGANAYAAWKGARLPTEAEWEYAAKGGNKTRSFVYAGSDDIDAVAWYNHNSENRVQPVGQKQANELGIYDMSGNVWEWCSDWYDAMSYKIDTVKNLQRSNHATEKVLRGGEVEFDESYCRTTTRYKISPSARNTRIGFRIVKDL